MAIASIVGSFWSKVASDGQTFLVLILRGSKANESARFERYGWTVTLIIILLRTSLTQLFWFSFIFLTITEFRFSCVGIPPPQRLALPNKRTIRLLVENDPLSSLPNPLSNSSKTTPTMKTTSLNNTSPSKPLPPSVRVDVKLCGSMSRQQIADTYRQQPPRGSPCGEVTSSHLNQFQDKASNSCTLALKTSLYTGLQGIVSNNRNSGDSSRIQPSSVVPLPAQYEPPSWSVPARGEARLEVCVDFSEESMFRLLQNVPLTFSSPFAFTPPTACLRGSWSSDIGGFVDPVVVPHWTLSLEWRAASARDFVSPPRALVSSR